MLKNEKKKSIVKCVNQINYDFMIWYNILTCIHKKMTKSIKKHIKIFVFLTQYKAM